MADAGYTALPDNYTFVLYYLCEGGTIYYEMDPSSAPATPADVKANGTQVSYVEGASYTVVQLKFEAGEHIVYAVAEVDGELSEVVSATFNIYAMLPWMVASYDGDIKSYRKYILVNGDFNMVASDYEDGHFNAVPTEGKMTFDPNHGSASANTEDLKVFAFEYSDGSYYLKDEDDTYYTIGNDGVSVGITKILNLYITAFCWQKGIKIEPPFEDKIMTKTA